MTHATVQPNRHINQIRKSLMKTMPWHFKKNRPEWRKSIQMHEIAGGNVLDSAWLMTTIDYLYATNTARSLLSNDRYRRSRIFQRFSVGHFQLCMWVSEWCLSVFWYWYGLGAVCGVLQTSFVEFTRNMLLLLLPQCMLIDDEVWRQRTRNYKLNTHTHTHTEWARKETWGVHTKNKNDTKTTWTELDLHAQRSSHRFAYDMREGCFGTDKIGEKILHGMAKTQSSSSSIHSIKYKSFCLRLFSTHWYCSLSVSSLRRSSRRLTFHFAYMSCIRVRLRRATTCSESSALAWLIRTFGIPFVRNIKLSCCTYSVCGAFYANAPLLFLLHSNHFCQRIKSERSLFRSPKIFVTNSCSMN